MTAARTATATAGPPRRREVSATLAGEAAGGQESYASEVILRNIRVLAIGQNVQERNGEKVVVGETATLQVEPGQVESLVQAQKTGTLSLALRSLKDANETAPPTQADNSMTLVRYGVTSKSVKP